MTPTTYDEAYYRRAFYALLPELYRRRDVNGELERFTNVFAEELARMRGTVDQLWRDLYIETCQDWVIPYLGDLVGTNLLSGDAAEMRLDVLNTTRWRKMKGTRAVLQETAEVMWSGGVHVAEMFERLVWNQHLSALRPGQIATFDLSDPVVVSRARTPFSRSGRTFDLRRPTDTTGLYHHHAVTSSVSLSMPFTVERGQPSAVDAQRFRFSGSNVDTALFIEDPLTDTASAADAARSGWHGAPLRNADFTLHASDYFGTRSGFTVREDGIPICASANTAPSASLERLETFGELRTTRGMVVADPSLFGGLVDGFTVQAIRVLRLTPRPNPLATFSVNYVLDTALGVLDPTLTYTAGAPIDDTHEPAMLLRIERAGADTTFPECEIILQNGRGAAVLVHIAQHVALGAGPLFLYVAEDGSTYFARSDAGQGTPDLNPDSGPLGAFLPARLSRGNAGQARPIPGVRPVAHRTPVGRALCCWDQPVVPPLAADEVAFDPERGRFAFPAGATPTGELTVTYAFGRGDAFGATPYSQPRTAATLTVGRTVNADHATIQAAILALPDGSPDPVVVEILDSATYVEALSLTGRTFPGGFVLRAARDALPTLSGVAGVAFEVDVTSTIARVELEALLLSNGAVTIDGAVPELALSRVTFDPATTALDFSPSTPDARCEAKRSIVGESLLGANVEDAVFEDSVVQHPEADVDDAAGFVALLATGAVSFDRCCVLGEVHADRVLLSNSVQAGVVVLTDPDASCARFSRVEPGGDFTRMFRCTSRRPILMATHWAHPGHAQLHPQSGAALTAGAEEGGEMGVCYRAGRTWRAAHVLTKHREFAPAGVRAQVVRRPPATSKIWIHRI